MSTVALACTATHGLVMRDPAGMVPQVKLHGAGSYAHHGNQMNLSHSTPGLAAAVTEGVDAGLWARWSAAHPDLVPSAVYVVEPPAPQEGDVDVAA